ncbi:MAG: Smr/MutS family protein, partial [Geminicoccaceae bacterium]
MSGRRPLTKSELDLWRRSTADVQPLADIRSSDLPPPPPSTPRPAETTDHQKTVLEAETGKAGPSSLAHPRALDPGRPIDIDRRNWERLKRGQIGIERKLDLHGRTQAEAHGALNRFLVMASAAGLRCVLVVTGKGGVDGRGVLRQMVPRWLGEADNRQKVLTYCPAQPRHGGDGALYV